MLAQADTRVEIHMARSLHEQKESPKGDFANEGAEWYIQSHANEGAEWYIQSHANEGSEYIKFNKGRI